jgi:hypothetical protein
VPGAAPGWLLLGVALHLLNQVARGAGWFAVVRAACGEAATRAEGDRADPARRAEGAAGSAGAEPRRRDVVAAWIAGAGAGGIVSARGGDAVRVLLLARRTPGAGWARLTGTLVAEAAGDALLGAMLLAVAVWLGVGPALGVPAWALVAVAAVALAAARSRRLRRALAGVAGGCAILRSPRAYATTVLPWQALSRALRLGALACFLAAFGLPATPAAVLLVCFAQTGARLLPFAPAAVGAGAALVAAGLGPVTGAPVATGDVVAFYVGTGTVLTAIGTVLALAICLRTVHWRELVALARARRPARA